MRASQSWGFPYYHAKSVSKKVKVGRTARKSTVNYSNSVGLDIIFKACHCFLTGVTDKADCIDRPRGRKL
jgi:hypothetical protein